MKSAYIFMGRSGCGKGTQVELLTNLLHKNHQETFVVATGKMFRNFVKENHEAARRTREAIERGEQGPHFLAIKLWGEALMHAPRSIDAFIFDGTPRSFIEAPILDNAFNFFCFKERVVVHLSLSVAASEERLRKRGRADDLTPAARMKRLAWFDTDVVPALTFFQSRDGYRVLEIDGDRPVAEIHEEIARKVGLR